VHFMGALRNAVETVRLRRSSFPLGTCKQTKMETVVVRLCHVDGRFLDRSDIARPSTWYPLSALCKPLLFVVFLMGGKISATRGLFSIPQAVLMG
jgi:hypothetical protein